MCHALSSHQASNARCLHEPASVTVTRNSGSAHIKAFLHKSAAAAPPHPGRLTCSRDWPSLRDVNLSSWKYYGFPFSTPNVQLFSEMDAFSALRFPPCQAIPRQRFRPSDGHERVGLCPCSASSPLPEHPSPPPGCGGVGVGYVALPLSRRPTGTSTARTRPADHTRSRRLLVCRTGSETLVLRWE